jgi:hypothetical protein
MSRFYVDLESFIVEAETEDEATSLVESYLSELLEKGKVSPPDAIVGGEFNVCGTDLY